MKGTSLHTIALSLCIALFSHPGMLCAAGSPWQVDVAIAAGTNDNLSRAQRSRDIIEDRFINLNAGVTRQIGLGPTQLLTVRAFAETEQWQEVSEMSRLSLGGRLALDWTPIPGPTTPSFQANAQLRFDDFKDKQRDSTVLTAQLIASKPISERFKASMGLEYNHRDSSGTVWDLHHVRGFLDGVYTFRPRWSAHGTYSYIHGDIWSTAQTTFANGVVAGDIFGLVAASDAIERDEAFTKAFCGVCVWHAYRLPAKANTYEIGINHDFSRDMLLDLSYLAIDVSARGSNNYNIRVFRVSLSKRF